MAESVKAAIGARDRTIDRLRASPICRFVFAVLPFHSSLLRLCCISLANADAFPASELLDGQIIWNFLIEPLTVHAPDNRNPALQIRPQAGLCEQIARGSCFP